MPILRWEPDVAMDLPKTSASSSRAQRSISSKRGSFDGLDAVGVVFAVMRELLSFCTLCSLAAYYPPSLSHLLL